MRGANSLIPARFLCLIGHLCVVTTLLWETKQSVNLCLPREYHQEYFEIYQYKLVLGLSTSITFIIIELATFIFGLTMFSPSVSLLSVAGHGSASILLTYFFLDGWLCDWYWLIFAMCTALPFCVNTAVAVATSSIEQRQLTQTQEHKERWSFYLVLAGVATTFGSSLPVGYNIGVINTPAEVIKKFCNESFVSRYDVNLDDKWMNVLWSSIVSIFIVGGCTGSILGANLANTLGRRKATICTSSLSLIGAMLFLLCRAANSVEMLILGRLIVGLAAGLTTSIVPMYLGELAPLSLTGAMGVACPMGVNVGVLIGQLMGLDFILGGVDDWPYLISVYALLVIVCLPMLFILPESPKYLFVVRREEEKAIQELSRLRGEQWSMLSKELDLLWEETRTSESASISREQTWSMLRVLRDERLHLPLLLTCTMQAGQQTSGINAVFYYSQMIFKQAGLSDASAQYATIGCGCVNVCTAVLMIYLLPRCGRRPLLLFSMSSAALLLALLAASMKFMDVVSWMPYLSIAAVLSYVLVYGFGLGPIPYFIATEVFEVGPRPAGMAWGSLANWGGNFLVGMFFPTMRENIGPYAFLVFSAITALLFLFQRVYFPETRGKTSTEVAQLCSRGFCSRPLLTIELSES